MRLSILLPALAACLCATGLARATPVTLVQSGYVLAANDTPLSGEVTLSFSIFSTPSGGTPVWTASCPVTVNGGYYAVTLGDGCGTGLLAAHVPTGSPNYLEVAVSNVSLLPRLALSPAPNASDAARLSGLALADLDTRYAKLASAATTVGQTLKWNGTAWAPGADLDSGGTVTSVATGNGLTGGPVTTTGTIAVDTGTGANQIPQLDSAGKLGVSTIPTITNAMVANGTLDAAKLATSGATTAGQVLEWTGSAWAPGTDDTATSQWTNGSGGAISYAGGSVGIGTATPSSIFDVAQSLRAVRNPSANFYLSTTGGQDGTSDATLELAGGTSNNGGLAIKARGVGPLSLWAGGSNTGGPSNTERLRIDTNGNVGIGSSSPGAKLDVNGTIRGGGTSQLLFADRTSALHGAVGGMSMIPGMSVTLVLTRPAQVRMSAGGTQRVISSGTCHVGYGFSVNGTLRDNATYGSRIQVSTPAQWWNTWSVERSETLAAGTYTINTMADDTQSACIICGESDGSAPNYANCSMSVLAVSQ